MAERRQLSSRRDYEDAFRIVKSVIDAWDPYDLLQNGAPRYEFEAEVARVLTHLPKMLSAADAAEALSSVFATTFETEYFTREHCAEVGKRLFRELARAGFIESETGI